MGTISIAAELAGQFDRTWRMFRQAVERFPQDQWLAGDVTSLVPARQAYHVVEMADYFTSPAPDQFAWCRFGSFWDTSRVQKLPSRQELLAYLEEVQQRVDAWLGGRTDEEMLSPDALFGWTGQSLLGRAVHLLRHTQHHLAEMNAELRRRNLPILDWR